MHAVYAAVVIEKQSATHPGLPGLPGPQAVPGPNRCPLPSSVRSLPMSIHTIHALLPCAREAHGSEAPSTELPIPVSRSTCVMPA